MFERELRDLSVVNRWAIVRTIGNQNVAEHTFYVATYVNDICSFLGLSEKTTLQALKYALWHDVDEIFTGDQPGPNKRALMGTEARSSWDATLKAWMTKVFDFLDVRMGEDKTPPEIKSIVKVADWLEAAMFMAGELQMGNNTAIPHLNHNTFCCLAELDNMFLQLGISDMAVISHTKTRVMVAVENASKGQSRGPLISSEMRNSH